MTASGIDQCSSVPLYVEVYREEMLLAEATAFCWLRRDLRLSLITNWHVAAGRHPETGQCLDPRGPLPDRLRVHVPFRERKRPPMLVDIPTVDADGEPLWAEHPVHGQAVDVVSLEFDELPESTSIFADQRAPRKRIKTAGGHALVHPWLPFWSKRDRYAGLEAGQLR